MENKPKSGSEKSSDNSDDGIDYAARWFPGDPMEGGGLSMGRVFEEARVSEAIRAMEAEKSKEKDKDDDDDDEEDSPTTPKTSRFAKFGKGASKLTIEEPKLIESDQKADKDSEDENEKKPDLEEETEAESHEEGIETMADDNVEQAVDEIIESVSQENLEDTDNTEILVNDESEINPDNETEVETQTQNIESSISEAGINEEVIEADAETILPEIQPEEMNNSPEDDDFTAEHQIDEEEIPEVESIEQILNRQQDLNPQDMNNTERIVPEGGFSNGAENVTVINNTEVIDNRTSNTGLHLLNYGLALRRDKRNQAINKKEFSNVNKRIDQNEELLKKGIQEKVLFEQQHKEQDELNELIRMQQEARKKLERERAKVVEKTLKSQEQFDNSVVNSKEQAELLDSRPRDLRVESRPNIQNNIYETYEQNFRPSIEAGKDNASEIVSEALYESQHERKDYAASQTSTGRANQTDDHFTVNDQFKNVQNSYSIQDASSVFDPKSDKFDTTEKYKDAVVTGAWGAVVGAIVFVLFYVLTR